MAGLTTLLYILPLTFADNFLSHRTPDTFLQLIHPTWILLTSSSHLSSLLTVEPRYWKFFAFFTFSPCSFNSSPSSTPSTLKHSVLLRLTFRPLLSSAFLQISRSSSSSLVILSTQNYIICKQHIPWCVLPDALRQPVYDDGKKKWAEC